MIEIGQYYIDVNLVINFLTHNSAAVFIASGIIVFAALFLFLTQFRPAVLQLVESLKQLAKALEDDNDDWASAQIRARDVAIKYPIVGVPWAETEERVITLSYGESKSHVMFGAPRDLWSPQHLLARRINLPLVDATPNLLVGVGLLLTFFFLTIALMQATSALGGHAAQANLLNATQGLLGAAGAKFATSLAGLLSSILWTIFYKRHLAKLSTACEKVLAALAKVAPVGGGELAMMRQVNLASETLEISSGALALNEELLDEVRGQHGTLKRFETDLAVSLANAINPQMEAMTTKLVAAIENLSNRIGTMNQEALENMMKEYSSVLKKATDTEMTELRSALENVSNKLTGAGAIIGDGAQRAALAIDSAGTNLVSQLQGAGDLLNDGAKNAASILDQAGSTLTSQLKGASDNFSDGVERAAASLDRAGANLVHEVEKISSSLAASSTRLDEASIGIKAAMNDLDASVRDAAEIGRQGSQVVSRFIEDAGHVVVKLGSVSNDLGQTGASLKSVTGEISNVVDNVEELAREQQSVVEAVRDVTPSALAAVERVTRVLDQSAEQTMSAMDVARKSMESTTTSLVRTVASINEGVKSYTTQVADLHQRMDGSLARAVGNFDKGITGLEEAVEELSEVMEQANKRRA